MPGLGSPSLRAATARFGGTSILAAGDNGTILRLNGTNFTPITGALPTVNFYAAATGYVAPASPAPNTYFVGNYKFGYVLASGASTVTSGNKDLLSTLTVPYYALAQSAATKDDVYMGGALNLGAGLAGEWDGKGTFVQQMASGNKVSGNIFAVLCGISTHYMAGDGGTIVSRASSGMPNTWSMPLASMTTNTLRGMWSASDNYIFAVGDMGTIVHFDGATWTKQSITPATTSNLRAIWGAGPTNIYAVGDAGTVLHYLP